MLVRVHSNPDAEVIHAQQLGRTAKTMDISVVTAGTNKFKLVHNNPIAADSGYTRYYMINDRDSKAGESAGAQWWAGALEDYPQTFPPAMNITVFVIYAKGTDLGLYGF